MPHDPHDPFPHDPRRSGSELDAIDPEAIGMVLGTEDATPLQFWFGVRDGAKIQLDDIVAVRVPDPANPGERVTFYGLVDEVRRRFEGVQFEGDTELVVDGLLPANVSYAAHVLVTRVDPEEFIPPGPGDPVAMAVGEDLDKALYRDNMEAPLPAGVLRNGEPGHLNLDFVNGVKGAHINISGISGIATKTSYALFLLYSMFRAADARGRPVMRDAQRAKALVFNVKGEDLLFLDQPNKNYRDGEERWQAKHRAEQTRYGICGLPEAPFDSCEMHAPARESGRGEALLADVQQREGVSPYVWSLRDFAAERMLPFVLADRDAMTNLGFLVGHLEERLAKLAEGQRGAALEVPRFSHELSDEPEPPEAQSAWRRSFGDAIEPSEAEGADAFLDETRIGELRGDSERLQTFDELVDFLEFKLLLQDGGEGDRGWTANQAKATREAFVRRLRGAAKQVRRLVRGDLSARSMARGRLDVLGSDKQVHVVDIHSLPPLAQMFVVGVLLKQVFETKERMTGSAPVFVVLDELNKYAPSEGESPIKDVLLDIAERGRSLGVILIGAQQTASEVERRIVGNAAVRVVGRLDAAEAERAEYRFMPGSFRSRATILAPGTMILHQPDVPSPMMLTFPFPAWATRKREVDETVSDDEALDILG